MILPPEPVKHPLVDEDEENEHARKCAEREIQVAQVVQAPCGHELQATAGIHGPSQGFQAQVADALVFVFLAREGRQQQGNDHAGHADFVQPSAKA